MKIRLRGNSLRLRLSVPEVMLLADDGIVSDQTGFGNRKLTYSLRLASTGQIEASFTDDEIMVSVPGETGLQWANSEQVSLAGEQKVPENEPLQILIEKDFTCLKPRAGEDESELFPNPQAE